MSRRPVKSDPGSASFESLVLNAMDFTTQAVRDLPRKPKYSAIHFYAAIELFLKARLLKEHWSLVVDDPGKASLAAFLDGDFRSATLTQCSDRIGKILQQPLKPHEVKDFQELGEQRNKLVHFIDTSAANPKRVEDLIFSELKAWHHMYRLITKTWNPHFGKFNKKLEKLNRDVKKKLPLYAKAKFHALLPEIEAEKKSRVEFRKCEVCGFESAKVTQMRKNLHSETCLVCETGWSRFFLRLKCIDCKTHVDYTESGDSCPECGLKIEFDDLLERFGPNVRPDDPDPGTAVCNECQEDAVVPWFGDDWLCLNCVTLHDEISSCGYCGTMITGSNEDTSITGCFMCDGPRLPD